MLADSLHAVDENKITKTRQKFPYEIVKVDLDTNNQLLLNFLGEKTGYVQVGPEKWLFPSGYEYEAEDLFNFEVRPDDVWIVSFPRSGQTLTREIVWLLLNNLNYEAAEASPQISRFPNYEYGSLLHPQTASEFLEMNSSSAEQFNLAIEVSGKAWKRLEKQTKRRFIKTHLPLSLLPPDLLTCGSKVIYLARNPKDVCASYFHFCRLWKAIGFIQDFATFWNYFERNLVWWTPYWSHVKEAWRQRDSQNLLFLFYEELNMVIYLARNPKDVCASFFHLTRLLQVYGFTKNIETFWDYFERNLIPWTPFWDHIKEGWHYRDSPNFLFLFYEDLNKDLRSGIEKVADFFNMRLTEAQCKGLEKHLKIENFRCNKSLNYDLSDISGVLNVGEQPFIRKGKNGAWADDFSPELNRKAEVWLLENLRHIDIEFPL